MDVEYFAKEYLGMVLYDKQLMDFIKIDRFRDTLLEGERNSGNTTTMFVHALHTTIFEMFQDVGFVTHNNRYSMDMLEEFKKLYEKLPAWMSPRIETWNKHRIVFENSSSILAGSADCCNWSGINFSIMYVDNWTLIDPEIWDDFESANIPSLFHNRYGKLVRTI